MSRRRVARGRASSVLLACHGVRKEAWGTPATPAWSAVGCGSERGPAARGGVAPNRILLVPRCPRGREDGEGPGFPLLSRRTHQDQPGRNGIPCPAEEGSAQADCEDVRQMFLAAARKREPAHAAGLAQCPNLLRGIPFSGSAAFDVSLSDVAGEGRFPAALVQEQRAAVTVPLGRCRCVQSRAARSSAAPPRHSITKRVASSVVRPPRSCFSV